MDGVAALLQRGWAHLAACRWDDAHMVFTQLEQAQRDGTPQPAVLDGLGQACYWRGDYPAALSLRARAYAGYRRAGDHRRAALTAVRLAMLHGLIEGDGAVVNGWVGHALRALEQCGECPERGWVELFLACIADEAAERERRAAAASAVGRRFDDPALEFDALAYRGQALVEQGRGGQGLALVDEAVTAVVSGVVTDPWASGEIWCVLFNVCEMTVDLRRARSWLAAVDRYVRRTGERPIFAICRMHYGGLLTAAGCWSDAERELNAALAVYDETYAGTRFEPLLRLAELRACEGRVEEAERLLTGLEGLAGAAMARGRLLLRRGETASAITELERLVADRPGDLRAVRPLLLLIDAHLAGGDVASAAECVAALRRLTADAGQPALGALAALAEARVAVASGASDGDRLLGSAATACAGAGLEYASARARLELAQHTAGEHADIARVEARLAMDGFARVGAAREADQAARMLRSLGERGRPGPRTSGLLTAREQEVLVLVAEGLRNADIAARLFISPRTVEHHVSSILAKLGLRNRAEAAAHVVRERAGPQPPAPTR